MLSISRLLEKFKTIKKISSEEKTLFNKYVQEISELPNKANVTKYLRTKNNKKNLAKFIFYVFNENYKSQEIVRDDTLEKISKALLDIASSRTIKPIDEIKAIKIQIQRKHLIKDLASFEISESGIIHRRPIMVYNKKGDPESNKNKQKWFAKDENKRAKREVLASEILRIFIPNTPKYRIVKTPSGENKVISQKVGFSKSSGDYKSIIEQLVKVNYEIRKNRFETNHIFAKQMYKILLVNFIVGNYDSHTRNIMYTQDADGNQTLYPIDFGLSFYNMKTFLAQDAEKKEGKKCDRTFGYIDTTKTLNERAFTEASYEISKIFHEKSDVIQSKLSFTCMALEIEKTVADNLVTVMSENFEYGHTMNLLMTKEEIQEHEKKQPRQSYSSFVKQTNTTSSQLI